MSKLALLGGAPEISGNLEAESGISHWPIVNEEMEQAVLDVLRSGNMSGTDITKRFEKEFAAWNGTKYALGHCSGTAALHTAMYAVGLGPGDEMICPASTYWASCLQSLSLGVSVVFADIEEKSLCIDPDSFEAHITPRTKAVMVVHCFSHPADMDRIMQIAHKHDIKVIEDVSHAQGGLYKGKKLGTIGDVAAMSLMTAKSFSTGEAGILITDNKDIYERALLFAHYERQNTLGNKYYGSGLPWGGVKYRMHQMSSAVGLVQLKKYDAEIAEIDKSMKYFWSKLDGIPGLSMIYPESSGSNKAGWYGTRGYYDPDAFGGLSIKRFAEAVVAEGGVTTLGGYAALHKHPIFSELDIYGHGKATVKVNMPENYDPIALTGSLPVAESIGNKVFCEPWFKHYWPDVIDRFANAFIKVIENYRDLLPGDTNETITGNWALSKRKN